jgi:cathepsin L
MIGNDIFSGAHFDEWVVDYTHFEPGRPDPTLFDRPDGCDEVFEEHVGSISSGMHRMIASLPMVRYGGDAEYDAFLTTHGQGRKHRSLAEYHHRQKIFSSNALKIARHNAESKPFKMAMNRFGDWSREEFIAVMLPRKNKNQGSVPMDTSSVEKRHMEKHELPYENLTDTKKIPQSVDWRDTGANGIGVKDQANCGSCWAFGAVGAMESAWYMATGSSESFSEQQVMDCAWGYPENEDSASACDGGDAWAGVGHIVEAGGISRTRDYQYLGQDDYCVERNATRVGKFKGFARIPRYDDEALMEAVYSRGPVAVSLDASQDSFTFYSSGVYYDTACMWKPADLDHSMMLVGYGTDSAGDYWLIKNSWSRRWGDDGYVKIARDGHGCGASSDALYVVVDDDAVTPRSS